MGINIGYSFYEILWMFVIYAFIGWCIEVVVSAIKGGKFVNRGFLIGPYCPIYGFGALAVILLLTPIKDNLALFFVSSIVITTLLELIVGVALEKIFHQKWWDYEEYPLNLKGYICLWVSVGWGVGCVVLVYFIQPFLDTAINWLENGFGLAVMITIMSMIVVDTVITFISLFKIKRKLIVLNKLGDKIEQLSTAIGINISDSAVGLKEQSDKRAEELVKLITNYQKINSKRIFGSKHLYKALPFLKKVKFTKFTHLRSNDVKNTTKK